MPSAAKYEAVEKIKADLKAADAVWVADYRGLSVKDTELLREEIRGVQASLKVYKNSLTELALKEMEMPSLGGILEGPSAFIFVTGDPVASAKALKDFAKKNPLLEVKGGLLTGDVISADQLKAIADLPSREELIAKLLGTIKNPLSSLVQVLNGPMSAFTRALAQVRDQREQAA
ncbi:MAG: 50S ribosomal protein L10 [Coriobacteriia bacterium]|nr:50S ribosomal protein L10 [Coriobacteriia bacterium]